MKYRVVRNKFNLFIIQYKYKFLPFWFNVKKIHWLYGTMFVKTFMFKQDADSWMEHLERRKETVL